MLRENIRPTEAEQEAWYETLAKVSSESLAFFYCCISFDLPFELEAIPRDDPSSRGWPTWTTCTSKNWMWGRTGKPMGSWMG